MSATKEYFLWLRDKYGLAAAEEDSVDRLWEFFTDHLDGWVNLADELTSVGHEEPLHDVFFSYSWQDKTAARDLVAALAAAGLTVWFDEEQTRDDDPGSRLLVYRLLHNGIARARTGLAFMTPSYLTRTWTLHEARGLWRNRRPLLLVLDGVDHTQALAVLDADLTGANDQVRLVDRGTLSLPDLATRAVEELRRLG